MTGGQLHDGGGSVACLNHNRGAGLGCVDGGGRMRACEGGSGNLDTFGALTGVRHHDGGHGSLVPAIKAASEVARVGLSRVALFLGMVLLL